MSNLTLTNNLYAFVCLIIGAAAIPLIFSIVDTIVIFIWELRHCYKSDDKNESHVEDEGSDEATNL